MTSSPIDRKRVQVVRERLYQMTGEMPSTEGGGGKGGHSDRTGGLAFRHRIDPTDPVRGHQADVAAAAIIRMDHLIGQIIAKAEDGRSYRGDVRRLDHLLSDWEPLGQWQTENLQRQGAEGAPGCKSCARVGTWSTVFNDNLLIGLCQTCIKVNQRVNGRYEWDEPMPPRDLVDLSRRGVRITDREIDRVLLGRKRRD